MKRSRYDDRFPNLRAAMREQGRDIKSVAAQLGLSETTLCKKLDGKARFTLPEARALKVALGSRSMDELFEDAVEEKRAEDRIYL